MPNDDLGTFPMPPQASSTPVDPVVPDTSTPPSIATPPISTQPEPVVPSVLADTTPAEPPIIPEETPFSPPVSPTTSEPIIPASEPITQMSPTSIYPPAVSPVSQEEIISPEPVMSTSEPTTPPFEPVNTSPEPITPDITPETTTIKTPAFEETPEEIPSVPATPSLETEQEALVAANEDLIEKQPPLDMAPSAPLPQPEPIAPAEAAPIAASLPPKSRSIAPIIIVVLLVIAGIGLALAAYLSSQTSKLKNQLQEITQTLEKQETVITPTPTPTVVQIPTPTLAPTATPSAVVATPSATPTTVVPTIESLLPLKNAPAALKVAIGHSPNAQLILIKVDNATDLTKAVTKYFFRQDTTTKKYFYVAISGKGTPEIIDKQIYVTPDDNIPSLNDAVLSNKLGLDLDEAIRLTYTQCANQAICTASPIKAQYIKTSTGIIWQLSLYTKGLSATPLMIQINAETKAILYKSPEFANK